MDFQFENICRYRLETAVEYQYRIGARRVLLWGAFSVVIMLFYAYRAIWVDSVWWVGTVVFLGLSVHYFSWPYRFLKKNQKRVMEFYDGEIPPTYIRFGDKILVEDKDSTFTLEYHKIDKVISLKHGYYLRYAKKSMIAVSPDGFAKGTFEEFKQFLRQKRPDLKIPE